MKKSLILHIILVLIAVSAFAQQKYKVTFMVLSVSIPAGEKIYITGNHQLLGNWNPSAVPLKLADGKWHRTFNFPEGEEIEFKITRGKWNKEALNDNKIIPPNKKLIVKNDTTIIIKVNYWADLVPKKIVGHVTGITKYHLNFKGEGIRERNIVVWLPPRYFLDKENRYPVIYMHDGQNLFDPVTSSFGYDWRVDEVADSLIRKDLIEELIVVGIFSTQDRNSEYTKGDTGIAYMNFVINKLKPFIDKNYRTKPGREFTATGGSSLGGLISFLLLWEHPEVFSKAACISPALKYKSIDAVTPVKKHSGKKYDIKIYFDNGSLGADSIIQAGVDEMLKALNEKGYKKGKDYFWFKDEGAFHNEIAWAKRVWRALIFLFGTENGKKLL